MSDEEAERKARADDPDMWRSYDLCFSDDPKGWTKFRAERLARARATDLTIGATCAVSSPIAPPA